MKSLDLDPHFAQCGSRTLIKDAVFLWFSAHRSFMLVAQRQRVVKIDLAEANSSMVLPLIGVEVRIAAWVSVPH